MGGQKAWMAGPRPATGTADCTKSVLITAFPQLDSRGSRPGLTAEVDTALSESAGALIDGEAIEQAVASGAAQIGLAATAVGAAGGMRRIPRLRRIVVAQALPVGVADDSGTLGAARPVVAGPVFTLRKCLAVRLRAGQRIVSVGSVAAAVDDIALFGEIRLLRQVVGAVELV